MGSMGTLLGHSMGSMLHQPMKAKMHQLEEKLLDLRLAFQTLVPWLVMLLGSLMDHLSGPRLEFQLDSLMAVLLVPLLVTCLDHWSETWLDLLSDSANKSNRTTIHSRTAKDCYPPHLSPTNTIVNRTCHHPYNKP